MRLVAIGTAVMVLLVALGVSPAMAQGITKEQADQILKELSGIRQALERLAAVPVARPATPPVPSAPPNPAVRMPTVTGYSLGRSDAPITMVEFTDLQCTFCARFHATSFPRIKAEYIDKGLVRFITRDFPLDMHQHAELAARATLCAGEQNHFWDVRTTLLTNSDKLTPAFITSTAEAAKLDMRAFRACLDSTQTRDKVQRDLAEGRGVGVEGTPTFIVGRTENQGVNGVRMVGAMPFETFDAKFKELLAQVVPKK